MSPASSQILLSNLELMFTPVAPAPRVAPNARLHEHRVSGETFAKLLSHWTMMPAASRPRLRGLSATRGSPRELILLLDVAPGAAPLMLLVAGSSFPSVRSLWPYSAWWEDELRGFEGVNFPPAGEDLGVEWRRA